MSEIINRVSNSSLVNINLDDLIVSVDLVELDIAPLLWKGLALKEQDFRDWVKAHDWSQFTAKHLVVHCSADAIIPMWAYMIITTSAQPFAQTVQTGKPSMAKEQLILQGITDQLDLDQYQDTRVIIQGCSKKEAGPSAYAHLVKTLQPVVKSIMFGEACSTVPVWKAKKPANK